MSSVRTYSPVKVEEFVFGLVYGAGTEVEPAEDLLRECLQPYGYALVSLHLSDFFSNILDGKDFDREAPDATRRLQGMGDAVRQKTADNRVLAMLGAYLIGATRAREDLRPKTAWLIRSLKRPEEVEELRRIYGPRFLLLGVHVPERIRRRTAARHWQRLAEGTSRRYEEEAAIDIRRDEHDHAVAYGQDLSSTFAEADFFVDARTKDRLKVVGAASGHAGVVKMGEDAGAALVDAASLLGAL